MSITVEIEIEGREQEQEKGLQPESNWGCYMYVLGNRDAAFWEMLQLVFNLCRSNLEDQFTTSLETVCEPSLLRNEDGQTARPSEGRKSYIIDYKSKRLMNI